MGILSEFEKSDPLAAKIVSLMGTIPGTETIAVGWDELKRFEEKIDIQREAEQALKEEKRSSNDTSTR